MTLKLEIRSLNTDIPCQCTDVPNPEYWANGWVLGHFVSIAREYANDPWKVARLALSLVSASENTLAPRYAVRMARDWIEAHKEEGWLARAYEAKLLFTLYNGED